MRKPKVKKETAVEEYAIDSALKLTELESLKFGKIDAEIRNAMLSLQLASYKKQEFRLECENKCRKEDENMVALNATIRRLKPEYEVLIEEIVKKYNIKDKDHLSIDPDTGVIREVD